MSYRGKAQTVAVVGEVEEVLVDAFVGHSLVTKQADHRQRTSEVRQKMPLEEAVEVHSSIAVGHFGIP